MSTKTNRTHWLDEKTEAPLIDQYVQRLGTFMDAMADGKIDAERAEVTGSARHRPDENRRARAG